MKPSHAPERVVVGFEEFGIPEVAMLGSYAYSRAHPPLRPHVHPNVFEVCFLQRGFQTYEVGSERFDLTGGDVILTRPGEVHSTGREPESPGRLYWLQFRRPSPGRGFLGLSPREARVLMNRFLQLPRRFFRHGDMLGPTFERILSARAQASNPLQAVDVRNLLLRLVLDVIAVAEHSEAQRVCPGVRSAIRHVEEHTDQPLDVKTLARCARMSPSHFKATFRREVGVPPVEYAVARRLEKAKHILQSSDIPVTEVALSLGFATSQHFATVFKRKIGHTPGAYRLRSRGPADWTPAPAVGSHPGFHPIAEDASGK